MHKMNYQRFFSRFYSSGDQTSGEILQKYVVFSSSNDQTNTISEQTNESNDFIEYGQQFVDRVNEDEFLNRNVSEEVTQTWNVPSPEETSLLVEPLTPEEVRWFYKSKDDKVWTEFNGYDSLLIEEKYRLLPASDLEQTPGASLPPPEEISKSEEAHLRFKDDAGEFSPKRLLRFNQKPETETAAGTRKYSYKSDSESSDESWDENVSAGVDKDRIVVRGGLYEVDLLKMTCESIYWPGEKYTITRGLYFYDGSWQPLERYHGEVVEAEHLKLFKEGSESSKQPSASTGIAVHRQDFPEFHIEWMSCNEIYLYWGGAPRQLVRSVTQKLGFYQSTGYRLRRGYRTRASMLEKPPDITHVVFVIHGIGQKMDEGRVIRNTNALRSICEWLRIHYTSGGLGRAELFPARWRAGARGRAAGLLAAAAPPGAPALRRTINEAAMDVMYYTSPLYGKQVQDNLRRELNRLYTMFMARNPQYKGQFSAIAHSLGSVIIYDLVIDYQIGCEHCAGMKTPVKQKLQFPLQNLFCIGSPLAVFLAMRHPNPSLSAVLPKEFTPRLFNIFHYCDPVAYRLEPLISPYLANQPPIVIPSYDSTPSSHSLTSPVRSTWRIWSYVKHPWQRPSDENFQKNNTENESVSHSNKVEESMTYEEEISLQSYSNECCSHAIESSSQNKDVKTKRTDDTTDNNGKLVNKGNIEKTIETLQNINIDVPFINAGIKLKNEEINDLELSVSDVSLQANSGKTNEECNEIKYGDVAPYRLDYTIKDTGMVNNYLSAITSHTSYWNNYDVAQFILSNLHHSDTKDHTDA